MAVADSTGVDLPARVFRVSGNHEFGVLSLSGTKLCYLTEEEYEYWIITHEFAENDHLIARAEKSSETNRERTLRSMIECGATFNEVLDYLRETNSIATRVPLAFISALHGATGVTIPEIREALIPLFDSNMQPAGSEKEIEHSWRQFVERHGLNIHGAQ